MVAGRTWSAENRTFRLASYRQTCPGEWPGVQTDPQVETVGQYLLVGRRAGHRVRGWCQSAPCRVRVRGGVRAPGGVASAGTPVARSQSAFGLAKSWARCGGGPCSLLSSGMKGDGRPGEVTDPGGQSDVVAVGVSDDDPGDPAHVSPGLGQSAGARPAAPPGCRSRRQSESSHRQSASR